MRGYIVVRAQFEATHCWPECPIEEVAYLRTPHRHVFHVEVKVPVKHDNRDVEFIQFKHSLQEFFSFQFHRRDLGRMSCEMIAKSILEAFAPAECASVFEDGENGAEVWRA
jgi:6-pyruvoyl-tetrahydropterin synthase